MPWSLYPSKDNKTQSEELPSSDELYCRSIDPLKEPGDLVAVLVIGPDQHYVGPTYIKTHRRPVAVEPLSDNKENRAWSQIPDCSALVIGKQLFHQRHARDPVSALRVVDADAAELLHAFRARLGRGDDELRAAGKRAYLRAAG